MSSLISADYVVTPVSVGMYELAGVADLMQTLHVVRTQGFNPKLKHVGVRMKPNKLKSAQIKTVHKRVNHSHWMILRNQFIH